MITVPRSWSGGLARDRYEVRFWPAALGRRWMQRGDTLQLCEQANSAARSAKSTPTRQPCARGSRSDGWPSSTALVRRVQATTRDPAARAFIWMFDARPAAAQDSEEEARTASNTTKAGARTSNNGPARAALRVPPPKTGTAAHCWEGGPFLRGQRPGAAREYAGRRLQVRRPRRVDIGETVRRPYQ